MNNIEIRNIKNLEPGMTSEQINKLKKKKSFTKHKEEVKEEVKELKVNHPYKLNLIKDELDARDYKVNESVFNLQGATLNKEVDWTDTMSPVKDQGNLGSCVAFSTVAMKEWQEQQEQIKEIKEGKRYRRKRKYYDLSEQWLYYNCKKIDPWPDSEGTSIRYAMKVLNKIGVPCESGWKYNDKIKGDPESWARMVSTWNIIDSYYRVTGIDDLRLALENGPVVIGIPCFREIFTVGKDGIVPYPNNTSEIFGGHAVAAMGFSDEKELVKLKNSWGVNWGQNGYGYVSYKYINDFLWDAWACRDLTVSKKIFNENVNNKLV